MGGHDVAGPWRRVLWVYYWTLRNSRFHNPRLPSAPLFTAFNSSQLSQYSTPVNSFFHSIQLMSTPLFIIFNWQLSQSSVCVPQYSSNVNSSLHSIQFLSTPIFTVFSSCHLSQYSNPVNFPLCNIQLPSPSSFSSFQNCTSARDSACSSLFFFFFSFLHCFSVRVNDFYVIMSEHAFFYLRVCQDELCILYRFSLHVKFQRMSRWMNKKMSEYVEM